MECSVSTKRQKFFFPSLGFRKRSDQKIWNHWAPVAHTVIPATQEAEMGRLRFKASQGKIKVRRYLKNTQLHWQSDSSSRARGPEFKPQHCQKKKKKENDNWIEIY
jgi:hypothetical protein